MSVHPQTVIVFGTIVHGTREVVTETITKYNEDTGKPYEKKQEQERLLVPDWVQELLDEREKIIDACYAEEEYEKDRLITIYQLSDSDTFLIGHLVHRVDMRDDPTIIQTPPSVFEAVRGWLLGASRNRAPDEIGLIVAVEWV